MKDYFENYKYSEIDKKEEEDVNNNLSINTDLDLNENIKNILFILTTVNNDNKNIDKQLKELIRSLNNKIDDDCSYNNDPSDEDDDINIDLFDINNFESVLHLVADSNMEIMNAIKKYSKKNSKNTVKRIDNLLHQYLLTSKVSINNQLDSKFESEFINISMSLNTIYQDQKELLNIIIKQNQEIIDMLSKKKYINVIKN